MTLFLSDSEARAFAQGGRVLWRESNYIPKLSNGFHWEVDGTELLAVENEPIRFPNDGPEMQPTGIDVPFKPGYHVDLKETWACLDGDYHPCPVPKAVTWVYKADHITGNDGPDTILWHSPVTMPRAAVRWHMTVVSVEVAERDGVWGWETKTEERG
jgi:hypothetical protein